MQNSRYALLGFAAVIIAGGLAAYFNMSPKKTDQPVQAPAQKSASADAPVKTEQPAATAPETVTQAETQATAPATDKPVVPLNAAPAEAVTVPVFDVLRLEGNGSLVIAGKASPNSTIDVISKTRVLGSAKAGENGDFAIVLDEMLKSGDYQLVLRATAEDKSVATSQQTAILSVPETADGQVLALVEEPGQASRMIITPQAQALAGALVAKPDETTTADKPTDVPATQPNQNAPASTTTTLKTSDKMSIAVEAVEIEGRSVFVAGHASGGQSVNVSANETLLGTAVITSEGRFLVQTQQPLAIGDYIIRADLMDKAGKVLATARVPFRREAGENIAAVAPKIIEAPAPSADQAQQNAQDSAVEAVQPLEKAEGSVIIRKGDNLWTISKRTYGSGQRYTVIYKANTDQIKNPDLIWPGQVFVMPKTPLSEADTKPAQQ